MKYGNENGWYQDVLGHPFESLTLALPPDEEGDVYATLIHRTPSFSTRAISGLGAITGRPAPVVLYLHGWSDYFFQTELADFWDNQGCLFYALDLRKFGRSTRPYQTPGYITDLRDYDEDICTALNTIAARHPNSPVTLMAHSLGGLIAALWVSRNPGKIHSLVLNAPWIELQGSAIFRAMSTPMFTQLAKISPKAAIANLDLGYYYRSIQHTNEPLWAYNTDWRPMISHTGTNAWIKAVLDGHAQVATGLAIEIPICMLISDKSMIQPLWNEEMRHADVVLDVDIIKKRSIDLGELITIATVKGAVHDVTLSEKPVRNKAYRMLSRWADCYVMN